MGLLALSSICLFFMEPVSLSIEKYCSRLPEFCQKQNTFHFVILCKYFLLHFKKYFLTELTIKIQLIELRFCFLNFDNPNSALFLFGSQLLRPKSTQISAFEVISLAAHFFNKYKTNFFLYQKWTAYKNFSITTKFSFGCQYSNFAN